MIEEPLFESSDKNSEKKATRQSVGHCPSSFYKAEHPECFSDSEIKYEILLTEELFEHQLELLSTKKLQGNFERFVVAVARRLITPNIQTQTGPDGGGDGKVDAETYPVDQDVSDKWIVCGEGAVGESRWAFAISCKKQWKPKVESDVQKIVETGRGYSRVLFFTNQFVKSNVRANVEESLSKQYGVAVRIFDASWCKDAVFRDGFLEVALKELGFSDEYKRKIENVGPNDRERLKRLDEIENEIILRHVDGLDTDYVKVLRETCLLSRGLNRPRVETEGRFARAMRGCERHGTGQQMFNLIYDHAWTSFFWFDDPDATYADATKLELYLKDDYSVDRVEKFTNLVTVLEQAARFGLFDSAKAQEKVKVVKNVEETLSKDCLRTSCYLFVRIYSAMRQLIVHASRKESIECDIQTLRPLLLEAPAHLEISSQALYKVMKNLSEYIFDSPPFESLVDELAGVLERTRSAAEGGKVRLDRAYDLEKRENWKGVVRHLGFCTFAFDAEEYRYEQIQASLMMGRALWQMSLPYCAEAYLIKGAYFIFQDIRKTGNIPFDLIEVLILLCKIELLLGRLVMYFNWRRLLFAMARNANCDQEKWFVDADHMDDAAWLCRFANCGTDDPILPKLPPILNRMGLDIGADYLKYILGYSKELVPESLQLMDDREWRESLNTQWVHRQFIADLNIAGVGMAHLETTVNNFNFRIKYENNRRLQIIGETFLATMESLMATSDATEVLAISDAIEIHLVSGGGRSDVRLVKARNHYEFSVRSDEFSETDLWECILKFLAYLFANNAVTRIEPLEWLNRKQKEERLMDRMSVLTRTKMAVDGVLGVDFPYRIDDWICPDDKLYANKGQKKSAIRMDYSNAVQNNSEIGLVNGDLNLWQKARWRGCAFLCAPNMSPVFGLVFEDGKVGRQIVDEWRKWDEESHPGVSICILKGINVEHPSWYRVGIVPEGLMEAKAKGRFVSVICQKTTVEAETLKKLEAFEACFQSVGHCVVLPFTLGRDIVDEWRENSQYGYSIRKLEIRDAYTVRMGEDAMFALEPEDALIIPKEHERDAPALAVLADLRRFKASKK